MSTQPSALSHAYTCQICRRTMQLQGPPIIGQKPEERAALVGQMLADHICKEHQQEAAQIMLTGNSLAGMLFCSRYAHNDENLAKLINAQRLQVRLFTKKVHISDEMIEQQVERHLPYEAPHFTAPGAQLLIVQLLKTLRDKLEETTPAA